MAYNDVCFAPTTLYTYVFILITIFVIFVYVFLNRDLSKKELEEQVAQLQEELYRMSLAEQKYQGALEATQQHTQRQNSIKNKFLEKIYDPLSGTSPINPSGSFSTPPYDGFREFQMLGYISGPSGQFPVMGRYRDSNRSDRFQYYSLDNSRNRMKIPFKTKNDNELYDGDSVSIPELGEDFVFKKYEDTDGNRYSPNII